MLLFVIYIKYISSLIKLIINDNILFIINTNKQINFRIFVIKVELNWYLMFKND